MTTEKLSFIGHDGHELAARLDLAEGTPVATALFAHCFTCGKDIAAARRISGRLATMGFNVLRFDFTGLGHSAGEFANTTFSSNAADLVAASNALNDRGMKVDLLIGHSLGGAAVLRAASDISSARAVVTLGAPFDPEHVSHNFGDALADIAAKGRAKVNLGGRPIEIGQGFIDDIRAEKLHDRIATLHKALLVMHAPKDQIVGVENASQIFVSSRSRFSI